MMMHKSAIEDAENAKSIRYFCHKIENKTVYETYHS